MPGEVTVPRRPYSWGAGSGWLALERPARERVPWVLEFRDAGFETAIHSRGAAALPGPGDPRPSGGTGSTLAQDAGEGCYPSRGTSARVLGVWGHGWT